MDALRSYPTALIKLLQYSLRDVLWNSFVQVYDDASNFILREATHRDASDTTELSHLTLKKFQEYLDSISSTNASGSDFLQTQTEQMRKKVPGIDRMLHDPKGWQCVSTTTRGVWAPTPVKGILVSFREWSFDLLRTIALHLFDRPVLLDAYSKPAQKMQYFAEGRLMIDECIVECVYRFMHFDTIVLARKRRHNNGDREMRHLLLLPKLVVPLHRSPRLRRRRRPFLLLHLLRRMRLN